MSPEYKFGAYDWSLRADVDTDSNNQIILCTYLHCKSAAESNFPVTVLMHFSILNYEKDTRRDFKGCKRILKQKM